MYCQLPAQRMPLLLHLLTLAALHQSLMLFQLANRNKEG